MSNEIDYLIVNLKILSNLEQNKKLITKESYLNVETYNIIPVSIKRYWRGDSRDESIKKIDMIITKAIQAIPENPQLKQYIENAKKGIINLKETYTDCNQTKARLDTIIVKIDNILNDSIRARSSSFNSDENKWNKCNNNER